MNEQLITNVFNSIVKYKPSLQKYLEADEPGEEVDVRILGDLLIKNFPWPIGVELRRLFSGAMRQPDRGRLDQLFKTIERTMQFLSFVMLAQLWEERIVKKVALTPEFTSQFQNRFSVLTLGNYAWLIRAISKIFQESETTHFISEIAEIFTNKFFDQLDFWVPERNEIGHYQINLTQGDIEKRCVEYEDRLTIMLQNIAFLSLYKLVTIRQINVQKVKHTVAKFNHQIDLLNSSDSDFKGMEVQQDIFVDSNSVLLMKDIKDFKDYLNLSPLIIDTRTEVIDQKEKFNIKKDIFLFTKFQNNKVLYIGTEVTEKCDLSALSNYHELVKEVNELLNIVNNV
jgi:hypothetical protein